MPTVVGVRLRFAPKTLWFDPAGNTPENGDAVIVETERGTEIGVVVEPVHDVEAAELPAALKPVVRVATEEDITYAEELEEREREALPLFRAAIAEHRLDMKAVAVEYLFCGDKVVFYFSAEDRVDFRELVKDLASRFRARIDMRQVGVRDEARMVGGVGHCGQPLCCVRFGGEFQPVSIRMAKEQDLPLNPLKISGLCGRLMCCLRYEYDAYKDFKGRAPKKGAIVETPVGLAKVTELNTPKELIGMRLEDGNRFTVPLGEMTCCKGATCPCSVSRETILEAYPASAAALGVTEEAEEAYPVAAPRTKPSAKSGGRSSGKPAAKSTSQPAAAPEAAPAERRRRRRGGRSGGSEQKPAGEKTEQQVKAAPSSGEPKPKPKSAESGEPSKSSGRRRRRRRKPSNGGSSTGE